jgi:hypothetical protein
LSRKVNRRNVAAFLDTDAFILNIDYSLKKVNYFGLCIRGYPHRPRKNPIKMGWAELVKNVKPNSNRGFKSKLTSQP